ncbi:MAG: peptidoglycan-binding protein [Alphaproteobacteria bacterium]|nr:peptidoglycan-binding protein [Alphaproteobacteria bacterium]
MRRGAVLGGLTAALAIAVLPVDASAQWKGALIGGGAGAMIGGAAGGGGGALLGGALGAGTGALIENEKNKGDRRKRDREEAERRNAEHQQQLQAQQQEIEQLRLQQQQQADQAMLSQIQAELVALGYNPDNTTGSYTPATQQAIEHYQFNNLIPVNGLPSQELLRHMQITRQQVEDPAYRARVQSIETNLTALSYRNGPSDGTYTAQTRSAIQSYQMDHGLLADGVPSEELERHIAETVADTAGGYKPGTDQMTDAELVREIQVNLAALEYDPGPIDGQFGNRTSAAIMMYQEEQGLVQSGVPSIGLLQHMERVRAMDEGMAINTSLDTSDCQDGVANIDVGGQTVQQQVTVCRQPDGSLVTITRGG